MRIDRFGETYSTAYQLGQIKSDDEWQTRRPENIRQVVREVGGADGVYDLYGDDPFPISALTIRKRLTIVASTYAAVETALETLRANTIALGRTKLWGLLRDGTTRRWTYAKCVSLDDSRKQKNWQTFDVIFH